MDEHRQHRQRQLLARDLRWAVESPPLWGQEPPEARRWHQASLALWAAVERGEVAFPSGLFDRRRAPIGRYFEALIAFWLEQLPAVSRLERNVSVQGARGTLGEFDVLLESEGRWSHWELAVKFYLGVGRLEDPRSWHGPLARDRLDRKVDKVEGQQLRLGERDEGRMRLRDLGVTSLRSHAWIKGYLFYPFATWRAGQLIAPSQVPPAHLRGWWICSEAVEQLAALRGLQWRLLSKSDWLAPLGPPQVASPSVVDIVRAHFDTDTRPVLIAGLDEAGRELHRGFVVPPSWQPMHDPAIPQE